MNESDNGPDAGKIAAVKQAERIIKEHRQRTQANLTPPKITLAPLEAVHKAIVADAEEILWGNNRNKQADSTPPAITPRQRRESVLGELYEAQGLIDKEGIKGIEKILINKGFEPIDAEILIKGADTDFKRPGQRSSVQDYFSIRANKLRRDLELKRKWDLENRRYKLYDNDPKMVAGRRQDFQKAAAELREVKDLQNSWKKRQDVDKVAAYITNRRGLALRAMRDTITRIVPLSPTAETSPTHNFTAAALNYVGLTQISKEVKAVQANSR